jgi:hypothetical protein
MMRTPRQIEIDRCLLLALASIPEEYVHRDATLRADICRCVDPVPTTAEIDAAIRHADTRRRITGILTEDGFKWKIADAGRAWLAENP